MPFTHDASPTDTSISPTETATDLDFGPPRNGHIVAVAVTVGVVGVFLFALITWLLLRLRHRPADGVDAAPSPRMRRIFTSDNTRPSTESKFSFSKFPAAQAEVLFLWTLFQCGNRCEWLTSWTMVHGTSRTRTRRKYTYPPLRIVSPPHCVHHHVPIALVYTRASCPQLTQILRLLHLLTVWTKPCGQCVLLQQTIRHKQLLTSFSQLSSPSPHRYSHFYYLRCFKFSVFRTAFRRVPLFVTCHN
jgi:hypothetical protein